METSNEPNILVVSNRLPTRIRIEKGRIRSQPSAGGLASALRAVSTMRKWIGWSGGPVAQTHRPMVIDKLAEDDLYPVFLTAEEERNYYVGMCNGTLWPLLHYFPDRVEYDQRAWPEYLAVNQKFADAVIECAEPGDTVWVHDFHLMMLPSLLRAQRPDLSIGFFLHVPFPSSEVWRLAPQREALLRGLLGADYIGFHTADYLRHFRQSCLRVLGLDAAADAIHHEGRRIGLGVDPLGPDGATFVEALQHPETKRHLQHLGERWQGRRLILGVERLDYTKGVLHKLRAFAQLLEQHPARREDTVMLQILVPSREANESYRTLLREIEREVGRINGTYGNPGRMPLEFLHRSIDAVELAALYRFATACVVAPLRDGMNLVAHEFVLCQGHGEPSGTDCQGSLVLSEFAGAALSLNRALLVNPMDIAATAEAIASALTMSMAERRDRTSEMYERVLELDSANWSARFLQRLDKAAAHNRQTAIQTVTPATREQLVARFAAAPRRHLFLDYDGTLREITQRPEQAAPPASLTMLLHALSTLPDTTVHIVSGRKRNTLAAWFGHLGIHLCAEHGFAERAPGGEWLEPIAVELSWLPKVLAVFEQVCEEVPGSFVE
ncbi:MAG: bifunctional alpha,alpha-trehalose-phosphate synthase (UDP-forming)/trehalose-phosphatase, partial [Planctomycetes bacterium]|nr:bifunctional alpha,alpha-trehalose-phosphate synthase (UDP-forming)/trehalose-phosphatase [Planctomycetota bacterium]